MWDCVGSPLPVPYPTTKSIYLSGKVHFPLVIASCLSDVWVDESRCGLRAIIVQQVKEKNANYECKGNENERKTP